jgi:hypothetical protein
MEDNDRETPRPRFLQLVGQEPTSDEQREAYIKELVNLKTQHGEIAYQKRRNQLALLIPCTKGALDTEVKDRIKAEKAGAGADLDSADEVFRIAMEVVEEFWHSGGEGFATFERDEHLEHYRIDHRRFRAYLSKEFGKINQRDNGKGKLVPIYPKQSDLKEAIYQLNAYALNEGREYCPRVRLNYDDGALWLDLGRPDWQCVRMTADGWEVLNRCKAKIIRGTGAKELPIPSDRPAQPRSGTTSDDALPGTVAGCDSLLRRPGAAQA